ncbi:hypothetical protein E8E13_011552 [Curvularia kusanoi]|uniref:RING-CH-type domain-containing protein n=1 Tax=Curvularia kusanoi TaxID=90978 RepID=A0A9P4TMI9_CURKU|nr:hypothetical protein E8E13_011552 [Curvularia kusanoi]
MASLPQQRPASQRHTSPPAGEASTPSHQNETTRSSSLSAASVDSQTLLLSSPPANAADTVASQQSTAPPQQDDEPRRCWICFNDETEDDETSSEWRSPCTCSLDAHEKCLLDWIADMEAPTNGRRAGRAAGKILCPQCKSEIRVERPRSAIVDSVRVAEKAVGSLLLPGLAFVTGTALYSTLTLAGTSTIYAIFGTQDAALILAPLYEAPSPGMPSSLAIRLVDHLRHHWRLDIGLPLIPAVLVASRTTLADSFLPFLPLIFFVSSGQPGDDMLQLQWPPSAAFSFACLPYLRGFYNAYYDRVWAPRERRWLKEVQPRAGTDDVAEERGLQVELGEMQDDDNNHDDDHVEEVIDVQVDLNVFGDWNNGGAAPNDNDMVEPAHPLEAPPLDNRQRIPQAGQEEAPAPGMPAQPRQRIRRERGITFNTVSLMDTILGALIFPSIAATMGELLRITLPNSWVTPPKGTHDMLDTESLNVAYMDLRESTHRISRPGVLAAVTGLPIMAYSLEYGRTIYDRSAGGIIGVMLVSMLGAFLLQTGVGLCMAWFLATAVDHTGAVDLLPSESSLHSKSVGNEKRADGKRTYDSPAYIPNTSNDERSDQTELPPQTSRPIGGVLQEKTVRIEASPTSATIEDGGEPHAPFDISRNRRKCAISYSLYFFATSLQFAVVVLRLYDKDGQSTIGTFGTEMNIAAPLLNSLACFLAMYKNCTDLKVLDPEGLKNMLTFRMLE